MHSLKDATHVVGLLNSLKNRHPGVRRQAVTALGNQQLDTSIALRQFTNCLRDPDPQVRARAANALGKMGPIAIPALLVALGSRDKRVRREVVWALGGMNTAAQGAVDALAYALRDEDSRVSQGAARALGLIGDPEAVPALMAQLIETRAPLGRRMAACALAQLGAAAVPALAHSLEAREILVRCESAWALGQIGPRAAAAVPALIAMLRSRHASHIWKRLDSEEKNPALEDTAPVFIPARQGTAEAFCLLCVKALGEIGPEANAAVPLLVRLVRQGHGTAQVVGSRALRQVDAEAADAVAFLLGRRCYAF